MRTLPVFGGLLHLLDHVLASGEIDECLRAHLLQAHLSLLLAGIDGDHVQAHGFGVLLGKGSETTAGTDDGDGLTRLSVRFLQTLVDCDAGAEDGCDCIEGNVFVEASDVGGLGDAVLLECAVDGVA